MVKVFIFALLNTLNSITFNYSVCLCVCVCVCVSPVLAGMGVAESYLGVWSVLRLTVTIVDHLHGFIGYPHTRHHCPPLTCTHTHTHTHTHTGQCSTCSEWSAERKGPQLFESVPLINWAIVSTWGWGSHVVHTVGLADRRGCGCWRFSRVIQSLNANTTVHPTLSSQHYKSQRFVLRASSQ